MQESSTGSASGRDAFTDPAYLIKSQYKDATNLSSRLALHERFSTSREPWHRWVFDRAALCDGERVLDVGCGPGTLWRKNADRLPAIALTLTDLSPGMLENARSGIHRGAEAYCVADVQRLALRNHCFDVVVANHMLYHAPDRERAIGELRRVLVPGGRLIASTNGRSHLRELDGLVERFLGSTRGHDDAEKFGLETSAEQLRRHFSRIEVDRFEDGLRVTETEAIVRYILSIEDGVSDESLDALRAHVDQEIGGRGWFEISKDAGVLIARA